MGRDGLNLLYISRNLKIEMYQDEWPEEPRLSNEPKSPRKLCEMLLSNPSFSFPTLSSPYSEFLKFLSGAEVEGIIEMCLKIGSPKCLAFCLEKLNSEGRELIVTVSQLAETIRGFQQQDNLLMLSELVHMHWLVDFSQQGRHFADLINFAGKKKESCEGKEKLKATAIISKDPYLEDSAENAESDIEEVMNEGLDSTLFLNDRSRVEKRKIVPIHESFKVDKIDTYKIKKIEQLISFKPISLSNGVDAHILEFTTKYAICGEILNSLNLLNLEIWEYIKQDMIN